MKNKIKAVIDTLQKLNIQSTYDNMSKLIGCIQVLDDIYKELDIAERKDKNEDPAC